MDVVGQAGKPKTITGFQTLPTPVLLAYGDRAELATEECKSFLKIAVGLDRTIHLFSDLSVAPVLEGCVILKKNPNYEGK